MNPDKLNLSVIMIALNEGRTIGKALAAVIPIATEIIVVDSGSTDDTKEIAAQCGAHVIHREWSGYAEQKNFALDLAKCTWVLNIDADEILTPGLVREIKAILETNASMSPAASIQQEAYMRRLKNYAGFKLPRVLYIGETPVWHGGFYPDAQLRLIRKGAGHFKDRLVHESISVDGPVLTFKHPMLHKAYANIEEFKDALNKYARLSAQELSRHKLSWWDSSHLNQWLHPFWTFLYRYIIRAGFLDGVLGLQLACVYSNYITKKIRYLRELTSAC